MFYVREPGYQSSTVTLPRLVIVHYLIRVLLSPQAFSIDRLARIVGLCARDLYRGSRVNPATRV